MTLLQALTALANNTDVNITITDAENNKIITFNAAGYTAVDDTITGRTVNAITIISAQAVTISIANA